MLVMRVNDWKRTKSAQNPEAYIELECGTCRKVFSKPMWVYNQSLKKYPNQKRWFCSLDCNYKSRFGHVTPQEVRDKISRAQKGITFMSRARPGHEVTEETKEKIRLKKLGKPSKKDYDIIMRELAFRAKGKYAITKGLVPDAIFIEDGKLVALEVEKERWFTGIKTKMQQYENRNDYDKVIIVWYSPEGERLKEWQKDNGEWTLKTESS